MSGYHLWPHLTPRDPCQKRSCDHHQQNAYIHTLPTGSKDMTRYSATGTRILKLYRDNLHKNQFNKNGQISIIVHMGRVHYCHTVLCSPQTQIHFLTGHIFCKCSILQDRRKSRHFIPRNVGQLVRLTSNLRENITVNSLRHQQVAQVKQSLNRRCFLSHHFPIKGWNLK